MQYSIAKLLLVITITALGFAAARNIQIVGLLCLPVGLFMLLAALVAYPIAILTSPQKDGRLNPASNPAFRSIHQLAGLGLAFIVAFCVFS